MKATDMSVEESQFIPKLAYRYQSWVVIIAAALFFFYEFIQMTMFNVINPSLMAAFHVDATRLGFLASTYFYGNVSFIFIAGLLLDRFSTRKLLTLAMAISVLSNFAFALSPYFDLLIVFRFLTGLASAFCMMSCVRLASRWFPPRKVALVVGVVIAMAMLGGMLGQRSIAWMLNYVDWRQTIVINAIFGLVLLAILFLLVRDYPNNFVIEHEQQQQQLCKMGFWKSIALALKNPQNWLAGLYTNFLSLPITLLAAAWLNMYLVQAKGVTETQASNISMLVFVGTIIGSPVIGWISDRIGLRKLPMQVGALLSLVTILIIMYVPGLSVTLLMVLFFLLAFFAISQVASYPMVIESNSFAITSAAEGVTCTLIMLSGAIFQPLFGWLIDTHWGQQFAEPGVRLYSPHAYFVAMSILPITFFIAFLLTLLMKETHCQDLQR